MSNFTAPVQIVSADGRYQCTALDCTERTDSHYCTTCRIDCTACGGEYGPGELFAGKCDTCRRSDEADGGERPAVVNHVNVSFEGVHRW